ncbi:MAG: VOC family protein [Betaproteobacteria bacterium]|nr:VOC family protein [Betaproteobacteria bacterium]
MKNINIYLAFNGECEAAFNFYKSVFGGEFSGFMRYETAPAEMKQNMPAEDTQKVMHVSLPMGQSTLMGSDMPEASPNGGFSVAIGAESREEVDSLFAALSAGGQSDMPPADVFWGGYFGMLTDKFGVQWMVDYGENANGKTA